MRKRKYGHIINMTSGAAFRGAPFMLDYVASKGALMSMTRTLARELGTDSITVNAVSPGYVLTEGVVAGAADHAIQHSVALSTRAIPRHGSADDIVGSVVFLASDDSAFVTGQIIVADGGSIYH